MSVLVPECLSEEKKEGFGLRASGIGKIEEGLSRLSGLSSRKKEKLKDEIAAQPSAARNDMPQIVIAVILAVVVGFGVSFAIEYLQAYLPSRDSSVRDLATNILGTLIGALATVWLVSRRKSQLC